MTIKTLESLRCDSSFDLFWRNTRQKTSERDIDEPSLPRKRRVPARFEDGLASNEYPETATDMYRKIYFEALDLIICRIKDRFDQEDYKIYINLEQLLVKAAKSQPYEEEFKIITDFYGTYFNTNLLKLHLDIFYSSFLESNTGRPEDTFFVDILNYVKSLTNAQKLLISEVVKAVRLILVLPATNASSERSFSALRRIKTYLRTTMSQKRLNHMMLLYVHKERVSSLNLIAVANEFVNSNHRQSIFGEFTVQDLCFVQNNVVRDQGTQTSVSFFVKTEDDKST